MNTGCGCGCAETCPACGSAAWRNTGHGALFWVAVLISFPLGLLLFLVHPETYRCRGCGHAESRFWWGARAPAGSRGPSGAFWAILGVSLACFGLLAFLAVANGGGQ